MGELLTFNMDANAFNDIKPYRKPFIIGVAGGTASGKTSVCSKIIERLNLNYNNIESYANYKSSLKIIFENKIISNNNVSVLCMDSFYRDLDSEENQLFQSGNFNFDHPDAIDIDMLKDNLIQMSARRTVNIPVYDYINNCRDIFDMKLFVDTDADIRLARRVQRDIVERGRNLENILHQYTKFVKPAFEEFCLPTKKYADIIIPRGAENMIAIDLIVQHIKDHLRNTNSSDAKKRLRHFSDSVL
ncbi:uridine-cytidine kinase 2-A-like isoform X2 [Gordionus sp. m RMFG-2023]|uniref:uridine-cytidine kinase 2-A-like isoform X2 n=1 Tax=Gordionus sp. m RMFG-2023 TaxID=3053472 RepID=UPI0031FCAA71